MIEKMFYIVSEDDSNVGDPNWDRSLSRGITIFILKLLRECRSKCTDPPGNVPSLERPSYRFSREYLFHILTKTMQEFRRESTDGSKAIIWNTYRKNRFKDNNFHAKCDPLVLDINPDQIAPQAQGPVHISLDFPDADVFSNPPLVNTFHSEQGYSHSKSILRMVALKFLYFYKLHVRAAENREMLNLSCYSEEFYKFQISGDLYVHHFFFTREKYKDFLKNTFNKTNLLSEKEEPISANKHEIMELVKHNMGNWEINEGSYSSIFIYSDDEEERMNKFIAENDLAVANAVAVTDFLLTKKYLLWLFGHCRAFVQQIKDDLASNREATIQRLLSKSNRSGTTMKRNRNSI